MEVLSCKSHSGPGTEIGHIVYDQAKLSKSEVNVAADSSGELRHKRLGHMSEKGMHILVDLKLFLEVTGVHLEKCIDCLIGK